MLYGRSSKLNMRADRPAGGEAIASLMERNMTLTRTIHRIGLGLILGVQVLVATEAADPKLKGTAELELTPVLVAGFSQDKQAATVLFRNLEASVGGTKGGPLTATETVTISLPVETGDEEVRIRHIVRGFASSTGTGHATLVFRSGKVEHIFGLSKAGESKAASQTESPAIAQSRENAKRNAEQQLLADPPAGRDFNFTGIVEVVVPAHAQHRVTLFLLTDRSDATEESGSLVQIDSLDLEILPGAAGADRSKFKKSSR